MIRDTSEASRSSSSASIDQMLGRALQILENTLLVILFLALVLVGLTAMVADRLADMTLSWTMDVTAALLLWLVMAGSMVAAGRLRHTRVVLADSLLSGRLAVLGQRLAFLFAAGVCLAMAWYGLQVVAMEHEFRQIAFGRIPNWTVLMAVPVAFGIMGARFAAWGLIPPTQSNDNPGRRR